MRLTAIILFLFFSLSTIATAQTASDPFTIRVFGSADTEAPTTPVLQSVTPVTSTQIDLTWSASTDNVSVAGYVISRGTSTLATTTLTSYSDTSVLASTTYSYTVRSFDATFNFSSSSNSLSTTTPDTPVVPPVVEPVSTGGEGTITRVVVRDFEILPGYSTTSIQFNTPYPVLISLRWGRTTSYELGYVANEAYSTNHAVGLSDLEPGTTYQYEIRAQTPYGWGAVVKSGTFTTLQNQVIQAPSNVARFSAVGNNSDVLLSWQNPKNEPVSYVRIVRSHLGFPAHPQDGAVIYQGDGTSAVDETILDSFSPVYYTAFTFSPDGTVSSGAVALVYARLAGEPGTPAASSPAEPAIGAPVSTGEATSTVYEEYLKPEMKIPELSEIYVRQNDKEFSFIGNQLMLNSEDSFTVVIPKFAVAGNLKSIIGTLVDPTDNRQRYSFLLRINAEDTAYEAEIAALSVQGKSALIVEIYDYEAAIVAKYQTPIEFVEMEVSEQVVFPDSLYQRSHWLLLASALPFAAAFLFIVLYRRRGEDKRL